ncbi:hypothetical protein [Arthrobacter sp. H14]|uniref:hypothetical protein n=1 Tax=Arthrobacter sp. H14 TaxID=1312959 RepID=UPI00047C2BB2|nr:hypothetical protein [Arthrobacter sp. H14]
MIQVVLVRPWRDAAAGGGCCSAGPESIGLDNTTHADHRTGDVFAQTYRLLREQLPGVDVQIVSSNNSLYLLPTSYRAARRHYGRMRSMRRAALSTTAGAVLVDGKVIGDVESLGPEAVLGKVVTSVTY